MDFEQIATFVEVAHAGSFSRAAQRLYRTQPAISTQVRLLEKQCGQPLFVRHARQVELTVAGKILLRYGERLRELREAALGELEAMRQHPRGSVAIAANEATVLYVLPAAILQFKQQYPDVRIEITRNFSRKIIEKVLENTVDFGVVTLPFKHAHLHVIPIYRDEMAALAPPDHPLARRATVRLEDLVEYPLLYPKTGQTRQQLDAHLRRFQDRLKISMELASVETIKKFVASGMGVTLMSSAFAQAEQAAGTLRVIPLEGERIYRDLGLIYHRHKYICPVAEAFLSTVRRYFGDAISGAGSAPRPA
ncbi:MAG TPA: LysR family transcriptional regulator [Bryobacterales bacterium]|nr:LysR family transcriptional regulator [Bryobacterales bacterium]